MVGEAWAGSPPAPGPGRPPAPGVWSVLRQLPLCRGSHPTPQKLSFHLGPEGAPGESADPCRPQTGLAEGPPRGPWSGPEPARRREGSGPRPAGLWPSRPGRLSSRARRTPSPHGHPRAVRHAHHHPLCFGLWSASLPVPHAPATPPTDDLSPGAGRPPHRSPATPPLGRWALASPPAPASPVPMSLLRPWLHQGARTSEQRLNQAHSPFPGPYEVTVVT